MTTVDLAVIGAGQRGILYARLAAQRGARVVAVAEPNRERREQFSDEFGIPARARHADWAQLLDSQTKVDAVVVAAPDQEHVAPAVAALQTGHHLLLEKPAATDEAGMRELLAAAEASDRVTALCHVLRYTPYNRELRRVIGGGSIGDVVSVQHLQPIGWWHYAHSFVRGNWRSEADGSSLLTAMAVHDIDWLLGLLDAPVLRAASFGSLKHFRPENRPRQAADRCLDCAAGEDCPYSAARLYSGFLDHPVYREWPLRVVAPAGTAAALQEALRDGPYGECVYLGRNDVVDHQVVVMELADGATIDVTLAAFTDMAARTTRVFGSRGWLEGDGSRIRCQDFVSGEYREIDTAAATDQAAGVYSAGDAGLMDAFLAAVRSGDPSALSSSITEACRTLRVVWAAERARRTGSVVSIAPEP